MTNKQPPPPFTLTAPSVEGLYQRPVEAEKREYLKMQASNQPTKQKESTDSEKRAVVSNYDRHQPGQEGRQCPRSRRQGKLPSSAGRTTRLPSIVPGDLIQPVNDPDTGLDIFPRLPEEDEDPSAVFEGTEPNSPTEEETVPQRPRTLSGRIASSIIALFRTNSAASSRRGSRRSSMSSNHSNSSSIDQWQTVEPGSAGSGRVQPTERKVQRSGGHVYCKHTWDEECKCQTILTLHQGDYCATCWEGKCLGQKVPYGQYPTAPTSPVSVDALAVGENM